MSFSKVDELLAELSGAADLEKFLETHALSAIAMVGMLRRSRGKQLLTARRKLARIHSRLVAARYSPYAVQRLCQLLSEEKAELRLKSAVSVLRVAGIGSERKGEKGEGGLVEKLPEMSEEEVRAVLRVLAGKAGEGGGKQ